MIFYVGGVFTEGWYPFMEHRPGGGVYICGVKSAYRCMIFNLDNVSCPS